MKIQFKSEKDMKDFVSCASHEYVEHNKYLVETYQMLPFHVDAVLLPSRTVTGWRNEEIVILPREFKYFDIIEE